MLMQNPLNIRVEADGYILNGMLILPPKASGIVVFAHGSGSSRFSPRNLYVAKQLLQAGFAALLLDLLDKTEVDDRSKVFDIELLARRLRAATLWVGKQDAMRLLKLGYFGASTGAAAALLAAIENPSHVAAVVSRGGRPDMVMARLPEVEAPTMLIVGGDDEPVLQWNREAYRHLCVEKELLIVPHATHLFEESGALEQVAQHAVRWFVSYLGGAADSFSDKEDGNDA